ncbi:MAG TPA: TonB-dependent receptor [Steroidobacteraceae bacterium]|nr:TonB-dependent receptor [Steroidobacteraceae bacterium]
MSSRRSIQKEVKAILTASALAGLGVMAPAHSQETTDNVIGEVLVKGIRYSHEQAIQIKRNAVGVVDAISAEDVGKFPDKNLGEALQRVPGVAVNREFGEGERINIRGTDDALTKTLLNGHSLSTADWFILDQLDTTRSFNYLMLPADLIAQTVVYKTSQADLEEGGIGGTVNVVTRSPLDLPSMTVFGKLEGTYTELADKFDPNASALVSWKNSDSSVGFLAAATYQERDIRRDAVEVLTYSTTDLDPGPGVNEVLVPGLIGSALFQQDRVRYGGNFSLQFRPSDTMDFNLTGLYSKFDADNTNANFMAWGSRVLGNGGTLTNPVLQGNTVIAGTMASPMGGTADFGVVYDSIDRFATSESRNIDLDSNFQLSDALGLHVRVGYTDAEGNTENQPFIELGAPAAFNFDLRGSAPQVTYIPNSAGQTIDPNDPSDLSLIFSSLHEILNNDDETYLYGDLDWELDAGLLKSVKFGVKYTDHERELIFNATGYGSFHAPINGTPGTAFNGGLTPGDFLDDIAAPGTLDSYWQASTDRTEAFLFGQLAVAGRFYYPQQNFSVKEEVYGGYVMGNFEGERWRGNLGVRLVETDQESRGNLVSSAGSIQNIFGNYDPIAITHNYSDVLPSLNVAYNLSDDKVLRFAAAMVMTRPNYNDVAPRTNLNQGAFTGTSGNPELDPFRANQADLSFEWYRSNDSVVALAIFYKDIDTFITDKPVSQNFDIDSATQPSLACTQVGPTRWNCPFVINQRSNGDGGSMQGAELAVTWPLAGGFGVQGNYTYTDAEADNGDPLPGASEDTFNLTAYFENPRVSARLAYTYRSDFFVTFDRNTPLNQDDLQSLDASFVFNVRDNLALTFDGVNLTDEDIEQYTGEKFRPRGIYHNGPVYWAGVRMRF